MKGLDSSRVSFWLQQDDRVGEARSLLRHSLVSIWLTVNGSKDWFYIFWASQFVVGEEGSGIS